MSKNKNYMDYYKKSKVEEPVIAEPVQETEEVTTEVAETEEITTEAAEEEIAQEPEEKEEAISEPKPGYSKYAVVVNAKKVNFRKTPDGDILKVLPLGAKVKLIDYGKDWCSVEFDGVSGFMMTKFLKEVL